MVKVGVVGGSGLDNPEIIENKQEIDIDTPYGKPSSTLTCGRVKGVDIVILARHGKSHAIPPSAVNYRANIWALKHIGCTHILATTAVGSLKKSIEKGHLVVLNQFIDFTKHRKNTFYDDFKDGIKHTSLAEPFDESLRALLIEGCKELGFAHHEKGTVITIEGPRFSTKAESKLFSLFGADVVNMTIASEAALAKEAGIPYAVVAMNTDYDCIFDDLPPVTWEEVSRVMDENAEKVKKLLVEVIPKIKDEIKLKIRNVPNFPKPGIVFRDITTLLKDKAALRDVVRKMVEIYKDKQIDSVVGIESRGFIFASLLAHELHTGFVPARKPGKLPAETIKQEYELEYGRDALEIHRDAIKSGENVLIVDDLLATGGTALAACKLVEELKGNVAGLCFIIELSFLKGREKLKQYDVVSLVDYDKE